MSDPNSGATFEGVFDVVDIRPKRHTSGNRLEIILSVNYNEKQHKEAIPMLYKQVKLFMIEHEAQQEIDFDAEEVDGGGTPEDEELFEDDMPGSETIEPAGEPT